MLCAPPMKEQKPTVLESDFKQTQREEHEQTLLRTLGESGHPQLANVACDYCDGRIVLSGRVTSYYLKQVAQEIVRKIDATAPVDNHLRVVVPQ
ncbi:BON domain-containing protein [Stieleria sp. ICT_E10.1]|uniref:BON domain-containing protein n=1 Tax=Stieleria sedimenti TaxID=2976331 RepID=UPI00217FB43C|nr:BON domain-containing protein [Stieleria sedimenti]MCS7470172.1 BON domain-containing protein [Stieleria sedimenti]